MQIANRTYWSQLLVFLLLLLSFSLAHAQPAETVLVAEPTAFKAVNSRPMVTGDNRGGFFALFKSQRGEGGTFANLYLQHVRFSGQMVLAANGVAVCPQPANQENPSLAFDVQSGLFVAWEETRQPGGPTQVFVQRLNGRGEPLWATDAVVPGTGSRPMTKPQLLTDREGGVYVFWEQDMGGTLEKDIYAQRLDSTGRLLWGAQGKALVTGPGTQQNFQLAQAPTNQALLMWEDVQEGETYNLKAQKFSAEGAAAWTSPVSLRPEGVERIRYQAFFGDGFGGLISVFEALGPVTQGSDVWILRVNRRGEISFTRPICRIPGDQLRPQVLQKGSDALVYWEDYRRGHADIMAQRVDINTGNNTWSADGQTVCGDAGHQRKPEFVTSSVYGNQIVGWLDERFGTPMLFVQKVSRAGDRVWMPTGLRLANAGTRTTELAMVEDERGGAWFLWTEEQINFRSGLNFQHVDEHGNARYDMPEPLLAGKDESTQNKIDELAVADVPGGVYVAWEDYRNGAKNADIYIQKLDSEGRPLWRRSGVPVCAAPGSQEVPVLLPVRGGGGGGLD